MSSSPNSSLVTRQQGAVKGSIRSFEEALTDGTVSGWRELVQNSRHGQPFYQPEWFAAFARSFAAGYRAELLTVADSERVVGVLPLMRKRSFFGGIPARTISSLSGIHSCRFDFITGSDERLEVAEVAWQTLAHDESWDVLEVLDVPEDGRFGAIVACAKEAGFFVGSWPTRKSPVLRIPHKSGADPFQNCPAGFKTFRKRLRGKLEKLKKQGAVSFQVETAAHEEGLARFCLLESSGWKGANRSAIVSNKRSAEFYSSVVEFLRGQNRLRLYSLCVDSKPISMQLGLLMSGTYYSPKVAYNENFSYFAPGHLLVQYIIEDLAKNGAHTFEFLGPRAVWKVVWAPDVIEHSNWYIFRPNWRGRCMYSLTMQLGPRLRALRHRVHGDPQAVGPQV